jgi:competence protein ComEC
MKNPFAGIAALFCVGILIGRLISIPFFYIGSSAIFLILLASWFVNKRFLSGSLILVTAFLLGFASWQNFSYKSSHHIKYLIDKLPLPCTTIGVVKNNPLSKQYNGRQKTTFVFDVYSIKLGDRFTKAEGLAQAVLTDREVFNVECGDILRLKGVLSVPPEPTNPGGFNLREHLLKGDIYDVLKIRGNLNVEKTGVSKYSNFIRGVYRLKRFLIRIVNLNLKDDYAAVLKAMLLGERQDIPSYLNDSFIRTGTIHILSISGMHVGLFIFLVLIFLKVLRIPRLPRYILTAIILICYAILTGLKPPIARATIMGLIILFGLILKRKQYIYNSLGLASLIILFKNPAQLFDAGFQLSFISVISTVYVPQKIFSALKIPHKEDVRNIPNKILKIVIISLGALIGIAPVVAYYFNIFSPVTILANFIIIPLLGLIVACGATFILFSIISLKLGIIFAQAVWLALWLLKMTVTFFEKLPFSYVYLKTPSISWIIGYYIILIIALNYKRLNLRLAHLAILGLIILNVYIYGNLIFYKGEKLRVTFLDVGHGDSIFMEFPGGSNMLVDTGEGGDFDMGRFTVVPFLLDRGATSLKYILLTHPHDDHIGGIKSIMDYIKVNTIFDNGLDGKMAVVKCYKTIAKEKGIKVISLYRGCEIRINKDLTIYALNPPKLENPDKIYPDINNTSIVLKLLYKGFSILLCGDIEEDAVRNLMNYGDFITAKIIKIPHHGSTKSTLFKQFLDQVDPEVAVISRAEFDRGTAVFKGVATDMRLKGIKVYTTSATGALTVVTDGESYSIKSFK